MFKRSLIDRIYFYLLKSSKARIKYIKKHGVFAEFGNNCFIGSHSVILPDVKIEPDAIVAAGAVVTKDVPKGAIVGGNPAKVIGSFYDLMEKRKEDIGVSSIKLDRAEELWKRFSEKRSTNELR